MTSSEGPARPCSLFLPGLGPRDRAPHPQAPPGLPGKLPSDVSQPRVAGTNVLQGESPGKAMSWGPAAPHGDRPWGSQHSWGKPRAGELLVSLHSPRAIGTIRAPQAHPPHRAAGRSLQPRSTCGPGPLRGVTLYLAGGNAAVGS